MTSNDVLLIVDANRNEWSTSLESPASSDSSLNAPPISRSSASVVTSDLKSVNIKTEKLKNTGNEMRHVGRIQMKFSILLLVIVI